MPLERKKEWMCKSWQIVLTETENEPRTVNSAREGFTSMWKELIIMPLTFQPALHARGDIFWQRGYSV